MSFSSIQDFRIHSSEKDKIELEAFILSKKNKSESFPNDMYNFSYSAASNYLRSQGYLGDGRNKNTASSPQEFSIRSGDLSATNEFVTRSFSIDKNILERIDTITTQNRQYSKKAITNKLLDVALKLYGY